MRTNIMHWIGITACVLIIAACFMPWVHYNSVNETFTGFHVVRFATGIYYGKAGIPVTMLAAGILILMFVSKTLAKRINLFLAALLFAYCIRTYIVFTGALFEGELNKLPGIYIVLVASLLILISSLFPKLPAAKQS